MLRIFKEETTAIDDCIKDVLDEMNRTEPSSEKYPSLLSALERLHKMKASNRRKRVNADTMALIGGNLTGILLIVIFESKGHVITSKGFSQLNRPKTEG